MWAAAAGITTIVSFLGLPGALSLPESLPVVTAQQSGAWSDPDTWDTGVPGVGDEAVIPAGTTVTVDGIHRAALRSLTIEGTLRFDPSVDTELWIGTTVVMPSGTFLMGSSLEPIQAGRYATLVVASDGPIDRIADPTALGRGLRSMGTVRIYGAEKTSWVALATPPSTGDSLLQLASAPVGWRTGDQVVVAGTTAGEHRDEVRRILSVAGTTLTIDAPLIFDHAVPRPDLQVHIANLTRNAVIDSQSTALDERGHVMLPSGDVELFWAGFYRLGRTDKPQPLNNSVLDGSGALSPGTGTNQVGRYSVHFHRNGVRDDGPPALVHGCVVLDNPGWGYVNHSSHVIFSDNVAYDVRGAGFVTEVGDEIGAFRNNIAIRMRGTGLPPNAGRAQQHFGSGGNGYWFQGAAGIEVTGNVTSGCESNGIVVYSEGLVEADLLGLAETDAAGAEIHLETQFLNENLPDPSIAQGARTMRVRHAPVRRFSNNVAYACKYGANLRSQLPDSPVPGQESLYQDMVFWNNDFGVIATYANHIVFRNIDVVGDPENPRRIGFRGNPVSNGQDANITYENLSITGYETGLEVGTRGSRQIDGNRLSRMRIVGGFFENVVNIRVATSHTTRREVVILGDPVLRSPSLAALDGRTHLDIDMQPNLSLPNNVTSTDHLFWSDATFLDLGGSVVSVFYPEQDASHVPFPVTGPFVPNEHVGLNNLQLSTTFGRALGGAIVPPDATTSALIRGFQAAATEASLSGPIGGEPNQLLTYALNATDPTGTTIDFTYDIDWDGDLVFDQTIVGPSGIQVDHVYAAPGDKEILVVARDVDGISSRSTRMPVFIGVGLASDDFQSGDLDGGGDWTGPWRPAGQPAPDVFATPDGRALRLRRSGSVARNPTAPMPNATLSFAWDVDSLEPGDQALARVFDGSWHTVWTQTESGNGADTEGEPDALQATSVDLKHLGPISRVRFTLQADRNRDWFFVDNVRVNGSQLPQDVLLSNSVVDEGLPARSLVGTLSTIDPDANDAHGYTIVGGTGADAFTIEGTDLLTDRVLDAAEVSHTLDVRATDAVGLSVNRTFMIDILSTVEAVASDSFESGGFAGGEGWLNPWALAGSSPPTLVAEGGNGAAQLRLNSRMTRRPASGVTGGTLAFRWDVDSLESGDTAVAEVFNGSWNTVWSVDNLDEGADANRSADALQPEAIDLSPFGTVTRLRFRILGNGLGDYLFLDDVEITR